MLYSIALVSTKYQTLFLPNINIRLPSINHSFTHVPSITSWNKKKNVRLHILKTLKTLENHPRKTSIKTYSSKTLQLWRKYFGNLDRNTRWLIEKRISDCHHYIWKQGLMPEENAITYVKGKNVNQGFYV